MMLDKIIGATSTTTGDYRQVLADICTEVGEFFGSMLGNEMSKLIEDPHGNFVVASDGAMLVREMHMRSKHPVVSTLLEAGAEQGRRCGDLVKMTIALACRLVLSGLALMQHGVHANMIRDGFSSALKSASIFVQESVKRESLDRAAIEASLASFLAHRLSPVVSQHVACLVAGALDHHLATIDTAKVTRERANDTFIDTLGILLNPGGNIVDSYIVQGAGIIKDPLNWQTTWNVESMGRLMDAKIAMVSGELYFDKKKRGENLTFVLHDGVPSRFKDGIDDFWARKARAISSMGIRVLITEKGIDDALVSALNAVAPRVLVFRRAKHDEMNRVAHHVGAFISHDLDSLEEHDLGFASSIEPILVRGGTCFVFRNDRDPSHHTLVIRGSIYDVCDSVKHHLLAAIGHCIDLQLSGIVPRFPWLLLDVSRDVQPRRPASIPSRARLAHDAFLHELAWLPRLVQSNRGLDPFAPPSSTGPAYPVTVTSVEHMLKIAAEIAIRLLHVDSMIINPSGWQKRTGQKQEKNGRSDEKD